MDHIESLKLKNFGPWKNQGFSFHPGVNVIIGESGHGKSAVLKALDMVMNNKIPKSAQGPLGFITRPEERGKIGEVEISMVTDQVINKIARRKGKSVNEYQLNDDAPQKAIGTGVPDHIAKIINMKSVNYHKQKHLPFLLDEKPGQVAKQLTDIINLQEIDESVSLATKTAKENRKILAQYEQEQQDLSEQIQQLRYVQDFKAEVDAYLQFRAEYNKKVNLFNQISDIVYQIEELQHQTKQFDGILSLSDDYDAVSELSAQIESESDKFDQVVAIVEQLEYLQAKQNRCNQLIELEKEIRQIEQHQQDIQDRINKLNNVAGIVNDIQVFDNQISDLDYQIKHNQEKLSKMSCPLCGRKNKE